MIPDTHPEHSDITAEMWSKIDKIIADNKGIPGSIIGVLRECQDVVSWLPVELIDYISDGLNLSRSEVFGIVSFYSLFSLTPKGRHRIKVLHGHRLLCKGHQRSYQPHSQPIPDKRRMHHRRPALFFGSRSMFGSLWTGAGGGG